ncbi:MAG: hypothetical protein ACNI22_02655 [Halarcobacter sp.]
MKKVISFTFISCLCAYNMSVIEVSWTFGLSGTFYKEIASTSRST